MNSRSGDSEAARKTIATLKARVRALYDEGPQTVIHKQLARTREREEEQRRNQAVMAARNAELQKYSRELVV